ncbi:S15/NS1 RNA-binding domain-containing protein [Calocera cornea HHB12733]|uniref:S15/NS1 RNA-binding domain-containing protein n=1 Tax=Calocera cornea HHB12733 TaxID=1353952 RepID=A0A165DIP9_9BASI|nr:S15/NS1 RNA-binding domain-containing protein [Calocera cornea HHB12733]
MIIASSSASTHVLPQFLLPSFSASFHTSQPALISVRNEAARIRKKRNVEFRLQRKAAEAAHGPHPVLGLPDTPAGHAKWLACDLARILVDEQALEDAPVRPISVEEITLPDEYQFGIRGTDERVLFESLPHLTAQSGLLTRAFKDKPEQQKEEMLADGIEWSHVQGNLLSRIVDLRNANAGGIGFENRRRCIRAFGTHDEDTGRPEVQAAILTVRIRNMWKHLTTHKKDIHNRRSLKSMVHERAKILKYLERLDPARFDDLLPRLGLDPVAVQGEIIVKFKF